MHRASFVILHWILLSVDPSCSAPINQDLWSVEYEGLDNYLCFMSCLTQLVKVNIFLLDFTTTTLPRNGRLKFSEKPCSCYILAVSLVQAGENALWKYSLAFSGGSGVFWIPEQLMCMAGATLLTFSIQSGLSYLVQVNGIPAGRHHEHTPGKKWSEDYVQTPVSEHHHSPWGWSIVHS